MKKKLRRMLLKYLSFTKILTLSLCQETITKEILRNGLKNYPTATIVN